MVLAVAKRQGVGWDRVSGTIQNDILKEYIARGTYRFPPRPSLRLITDVFAFCAREVPKWNTISISGYHIREAGSTAVQEVAFTLANAREYVRAAVAAGLAIEEFAPRLSFFFNAHNNLLEEVAKFRAARRMWARMMRDEFGARDPRSWVLRFHTQTAGSTLTAQQPETNVVRVAIQAMAAVAGGTQSLHTNAMDEALALPTENSALLALRTQQVVAYESGLADVVDPLGGAYVVEAWTDRIEAEARAYIERIEAMGGALAAIEHGFQQREIHEAAYRTQRAIEAGTQVVVGVNKFRREQEEPIPHVPHGPGGAAGAGGARGGGARAARRGAGAAGAGGAGGGGARARQPDAADRRGGGRVRDPRRDRVGAGARCSASTGRGWRCEERGPWSAVGGPSRVCRRRSCWRRRPASGQERATLTVLFTSDMHAHVLPFDDVRERPARGSIAQVATVVARERQANPANVVLDGGDEIEGTPLEYYAIAAPGATGADPAIAAMNLVGYDAAVLGNHEFNFGLDVLRRSLVAGALPVARRQPGRRREGRAAGGRRARARARRRPRRRARAHQPQHPALGPPGALARPHLRRPGRGGGRHASPSCASAPTWSSSWSTAGSSATSRPAPPTGPRTRTSRWRLAQLPGIDLLLTGHTHRNIPPQRLGATVVAQPGRWGEFVTRVDLDLAREGGAWKVTGWRGENIPTGERDPGPPGGGRGRRPRRRR